MADYIQALNEGFAAAKKAEIARKEITDVLAKLKSDLIEASHGKLLVQIEQLEDRPNLAPTSVLDTAGSLGNLATIMVRASQPKTYYEALTAKNPNSPNPTAKPLARWKQSKDGYPCSLIWNKQERQCEDRTALEESLAELLRDPLVGEQLYQLTKMN